jgi:dinuclear metal center YbgI/SA1388 family protein
MNKPAQTQQYTVGDVCNAMESIAPTGLAEDWDNVGLLAGDPSAPVSRVLTCVDLTPAVFEEAVRENAELVLAYHPPIFKPISSMRADGTGPEATVFRCIRSGIAVYAAHTALDAADGGTNDTIASLCGIKETEPIEYVDEPSVSECKLVVFVPQAGVEQVAEAMFAAGAGHIGDYGRCSYRTSGQGTFFGGQTTSPTIGERGRMEYVDEIRLETVVPSKALPAVVNALRKAHPYEEPAFDIYPLRPRPARGMGRIGALPHLMTLTKLVHKLKRATKAACVQVIGPPDRTIERAIIVAGSAGSVPFRVPLVLYDVIITGEIRHHDALTIQRIGCTAIALGHWASERPVLKPLAQRVEQALPGVTVHISTADHDPFQRV